MGDGFIRTLRATDANFTAGVQNLFDVYPEKREGNNFNGIFVYPLTNTPFGFNGVTTSSRLSTH